MKSVMHDVRDGRGRWRGGGVLTGRRPMIKAVFFDFDGVLTTDRSGSTTTIAYLSRTTGVPQEALWEAFAPFNDDLIHGRTTHAGIWAGFCDRLGVAIDFGALAEAFASTPMNAEMIGLARALRTRYAVGIITDNKRDRIDYLRKSAALDDLFSPIVVSAECGSGKDAPAIFLAALGRLNLAPGEALFIDNTERNLRAPAALGMHTIFYDDAANDVAGLTSRLRWEFGVDATRHPA